MILLILKGFAGIRLDGFHSCLLPPMQLSPFDPVRLRRRQAAVALRMTPLPVLTL